MLIYHYSPHVVKHLILFLQDLTKDLWLTTKRNVILQKTILTHSFCNGSVLIQFDDSDESAETGLTCQSEVIM